MFMSMFMSMSMSHVHVHVPCGCCALLSAWPLLSERRGIRVAGLFACWCGAPGRLLDYKDRLLQHNADPRRTRFDDAAVREQLSRHGARVQEVLGPAGTAVAFETSSVHRGMPCRTGPGRVSLTNYYRAKGGTLPSCGAAVPAKPVQSGGLVRESTMGSGAGSGAGSGRGGGGKPRV